MMGRSRPTPGKAKWSSYGWSAAGILLVGVVFGLVVSGFADAPPWHMGHLTPSLNSGSITGETAGATADETNLAPTSGSAPRNSTNGLTENGTAHAAAKTPTPGGSSLAKTMSGTTGQPTTQLGQLQSLSNGSAHKDDETDGKEPTARLAISGRVLDEAGQAVPWVELLIEPVSRIDPKDAQEVLLLGPGQSDFNGYYRFSALPPGEYRIQTAPSDDYAPAQAAVRAGEQSADLILSLTRQEQQIYGFVGDADGEPVAGVLVSPMVPGGQATHTDSRGNYSVTVTVKGGAASYPIRYQREGYGEQRIRVHTNDGASLQRDVAMREVATLAPVQGTVQGTNDRPVVGELVHFYSQRLNRSYQAVTDRNGRFSIAEVEVGDDYRLSIAPRGQWEDYSQMPIEVGAQGLSLHLVLEPVLYGAVNGWMLDVDGMPIRGVNLMLHSTSAIEQGIPVTGDSDGRYAANNVPEGHLMFVSRSSPYFKIEGIELQAGDREEVPLILDWGHYELTGRILDDAGVPVSAPHVSLAWTHAVDGVQSHSSRRVAVGADGFFKFTQLGRGRHTLTVSAPGYETVRVEHDVGSKNGELLVQLRAM